MYLSQVVLNHFKFLLLNAVCLNHLQMELGCTCIEFLHSVIVIGLQRSSRPVEIKLLKKLAKANGRRLKYKYQL